MRTTAIVLSAGQGKRLGADIPKQYIDAGGHPLLYYCLKAFEESNIDDVIVVAEEEYFDLIKNLGFSKISAIVKGGEKRYNSVYEGLKAAEGTDYVLIHDGARPFIKPAVINALIEEVIKCEAVIAGMPMKDTVKIANSKGYIVSSTERRFTWMVQTPQCFKRRVIAEAYKRGLADPEFVTTDDCGVVHRYMPEVPIFIVDGESTNIKITFKEDIKTFESYLNR